MLDLKFGATWAYGDKRGSFTLFHRPFLEALQNWAPAFELIAEDVLEPHVMRAFGSEGAADGVKWQELAPSTLRGRPATPILQVTGEMLHSFQRGGPNHVENVTARKLIWGSSDPKALFHEFGTGGKVNFRRAGARAVIAKTAKAREGLAAIGGKAGGIPARPMLVFSTFLANEIASKMLGRVAQVARQVGYKVTSGSLGGVTPVEARQIGEQILGGATA